MYLPDLQLRIKRMEIFLISTQVIKSSYFSEMYYIIFLIPTLYCFDPTNYAKLDIFSQKYKVLRGWRGWCNILWIIDININ